MMSYPVTASGPLDAIEERRLVGRAKRGDPGAMNTLLAASIKGITATVTTNAAPSEREDAMSVAVLAFIETVLALPADVAVWRHASVRVTNAVRDYSMTSPAGVAIPLRGVYRYRAARKAMPTVAMAKAHACDPSRPDAISPAAFDDIHRAMRPVLRTEHNPAVRTNPDPMATVDDVAHANQLLGQLTDRSATILRMSCGWNDRPLTDGEIGAQLGLSRSRVTNVRNQSLATLRTLSAA